MSTDICKHNIKTLECAKCGWASYAQSEATDAFRRKEMALLNCAVESLSAQVAELQRIKHLAWHVLESSEERVQEDEIVVDRGDFEALSEALPESHHELTVPAKREYDAIADAVNEVADAAQAALRKAGIEPGEWDSDDIVKDVSRGIADCVESLGAQVAELKKDAERVLYKQCSKHEGMSYTFKATTVSYTKIVCPNCLNAAKASGA